ncbi:MAG: hypothetical protein H6696_01860 [Deferribacteres bacterium]|nr:hypothetical protein [candidate division KSB1 bacterium]MCB9500657.1 hypothetical protein [Deferribacteres bacterium]
MATFQVKVLTKDGLSGATFSPVSITAAPGDGITFQSQHEGTSVPQQIKIALTSGNTCSSDAKTKADAVTLAGNGSASVTMCKNARPGTITYQNMNSATATFGPGSMSRTSPTATLTGDPEPVMGDDG